MRRAARAVVPPLLTAAVIVSCWYLVTYFALDPQRRFLLPPPHQVVEVGLLDVANLAEILGALWSTALVALGGLALAVVVGVTLGAVMSQARWIERSLYPWAVALQTIPILAMVPLIGFWFGFGFGSRVLVCVLIAVFPIVTTTLFGLQSVERGMHELFDLHNASRWTRLRRLQAPAALPALFVGLRTSAGLSVIGAIVGDFFFRQGQPGIGRLIDIYRAQLQSEQLITAVTFSSLLGLAVFAAFGLLARRVVGGWHHSTTRQ